MVKEVAEYNRILNELADRIKSSHYKTEYFIQKLGIPQASFYRKLRSNSFSPEEVLVIARILEPEEYLEMILEESERDYQEGKVITHKEVMSRMRKKYL